MFCFFFVSILCSKVDEYGFQRPEDFNYKEYETFISGYMMILTRRAMRWNQVLTPGVPRNGSVIKRFVRKGIPAQHRGKVGISLNYFACSRYRRAVHALNN